MEDQSTIIPPHGGYRNLKSFQTAEIIYDATAAFCDRFIDKRSRTHDQMVQAARSGKQNIAEGAMVSGTSKKSEIKLIGVARASLEELLLDFHDFLRQRRLPLWGKEDPRAQTVRKLAYEKIGPMRPIGPITKALLKPPPTLSSASFTRRITCWISNSASWRSSFWRKAGLQKSFIMPVSRRGRDSEAFRLRSVNGLN